MPAAGNQHRVVPAFHCRSLGGGGARLCPSGLATGTPQTFPMASPDGSRNPPGKFPPPEETAGRTAPGPYLPDFEPVYGLKDVTTPVPRVLLSATLAGPAPSGSTGHVPALSGLLPPSPAPPGSGCPQLHRPAATRRRRRSLTSTRTTAPRCAGWRSLAAQPRCRRESPHQIGQRV